MKSFWYIVGTILISAVAVFLYIDNNSEEKMLIHDMKIGEVISLVLTVDDKVFALEKSINGWDLTSPINYKADSQTVEQALKLIFNEPKFLAPDRDGYSILMQNVGLTTPRTFLEVVSQDKSIRLEFGSVKTNDDRYFYVKRTGTRQICFVSTLFDEIIKKPLYDWRSKEIVPRMQDVKSVEIHTKTNHLSFLKEKEKWSTYPKKNIFLSSKNINTWLEALYSMRVVNFASETSLQRDLIKYGLNKPDAEVKIKDLKSEISVWMSLHKSGTKGYVRNSISPVIFEVTHATLLPFTKNLDDFRDLRQPFEVDFNKISQIWINLKNQQIGMLNYEGVWKLAPGINQKGEINHPEMSKLIKEINTISIDRYVDKKNKLSLNQLGNSIVLKDANGQPVLDFKWGSRVRIDGKEYYLAKTNLSEEFLAIEPSKLDQMPVTSLIKNASPVSR